MRCDMIDIFMSESSLRPVLDYMRKRRDICSCIDAELIICLV